MEKDQPADQSHPKQWEPATAPTRDTALRSAGLRIPDDDPLPPIYRQRPPPAGDLVYSPRAQALLRSVCRSSVPRPTMGHQRTNTMIAPGATPPGAIGDPTTLHKVLRGVLQRGTKPWPSPWPKSPRGKRATTWDWPCSSCPSGSSAAGRPQGPYPGSGPFPPPAHKSRRAPTHGKTPPGATTPPHLRVPRRPQGPPAHGP